MRSWLPRRVPVAVLGLTLASGLIPGLSRPAEAGPHGPAVVAPGCYGNDGVDFDADGKTDVAAGAPRGDTAQVHDAGVVEVRYGCDARSPQRLALPHPHRGDRFGAALASGRYVDRGHAYTALFVGAPYLDVDGHKNAGGVVEFHASSAGLRFVKLWTQATHGVPGTVQAGAHFGAALSLSDADEERFHLQIGEPRRNVGHAADTGGYVVLSWRADPDDPPDTDAEVTLRGLGLHAHDGDLFGSSFAQGTSFRVGAPGRRVHGRAGAGAVLDRSQGVLVDQATPGVPGSPEKGDHFGASLSGNWIGVPDEAVGDVSGAGLVEYWDPSEPASATSVDQDAAGVPGDVGADHHFGTSLDVDDHSDFSDVEVFVGAPGDRSGAGSVTLLRHVQDGTFASASALPGPDRAGAHAGATLGSSGLYRELVGAPGTDGGRVSSYVLYPEVPGGPDLESSWTQSGGRETGQLGASLSGPELDADE